MMQKNNGIGFFSAVLPTMLVFSVMANGTTAVDRAGDEHAAPKKTGPVEEQLNQSQQKNNSHHDDGLMPKIYINPNYIKIDPQYMKIDPRQVVGKPEDLERKI